MGYAIKMSAVVFETGTDIKYIYAIIRILCCNCYIIFEVFFIDIFSAPTIINTRKAITVVIWKWSNDDWVLQCQDLVVHQISVFRTYILTIKMFIPFFWIALNQVVFYHVFISWAICPLKSISKNILISRKLGTIIFFNFISWTKPTEGEDLKKTNYKLQDNHGVFT